MKKKKKNQSLSQQASLQLPVQIVKKYLVCKMFPQYFNIRVDNDRLTTFVMLCTNWYYLNNLKNLKNTHQTINQMKERLGMDSILREGKSQW